MHRYKLLADALNLSVLALENEIQVGNTTLDKAIKRGSKISTDITNRILDKFPQVNKDWLLNGSGPMFTEPHPPAITGEGWQRATDKPGYLLSAEDMEIYAAIKKEFEGRNIYEVIAEMYVRIKNLEKQK